MEERRFKPTSQPGAPAKRRVKYSPLRVFGVTIALGLLFFIAAWLLGASAGEPVRTLSLIGFSIVAEAQPGAAASLVLGFHPVVGALISICSNFILIPLMMFGYDQLISRWHWLQRHLERSEKWTKKYGRYGVWVLCPLTPVIGAYLCIAVSHGLGWSRWSSLLSIAVGIVASTFVITLFGHIIVHELVTWRQWLP